MIHFKFFSGNTKIVKYLGINMTKTAELLHAANYNPLNEYLQKKFERWSTHPLDYDRKINVVKIHILMRLLYLFQSVPLEIPIQQFVTWDKIFVKGKLQLPKDGGGMSLQNLKLHFQEA